MGPVRHTGQCVGSGADAWVNSYTEEARGAARTPSVHRVIQGGSWDIDVTCTTMRGVATTSRHRDRSTSWASAVLPSSGPGRKRREPGSEAGGCGAPWESRIDHEARNDESRERLRASLGTRSVSTIGGFIATPLVAPDRTSPALLPLDYRRTTRSHLGIQRVTHQVRTHCLRRRSPPQELGKARICNRLSRDR